MSGDGAHVPPLWSFHTVPISSATSDRMYHPTETKKGVWTCECRFMQEHPFGKCQHVLRLELMRRAMEIDFLKNLVELPEDTWETIENVVAYFVGTRGVEMNILMVRILEIAEKQPSMTSDDLFESFGEKTFKKDKDQKDRLQHLIGACFRWLSSHKMIERAGFYNVKKRKTSHGSVVFRWAITDEGRKALQRPLIAPEFDVPTE